MSQSFADLTLFSVVQFGVGLYWLFTGLNGFFNWVKTPEASPRFTSFVSAFYATGFFMPLIKSIEVLIGVLLICNIWIGFALVLFGGLLFVIVPAQMLLNWPKGITLSLMLILPYALLVYYKWEIFRPLF